MSRVIVLGLDGLPCSLLRRFIAENYVTYDKANGFELKYLRGQAAPPLQPRPASP